MYIAKNVVVDNPTVAWRLLPEEFRKYPHNIQLYAP